MSPRTTERIAFLDIGSILAPQAENTRGRGRAAAAANPGLALMSDHYFSILEHNCKKFMSRRHRGRPGRHKGRGNMAQPLYIAVIGGSDISSETAGLARDVGREVAARGAVLLCGGLGGVMAAAAQGAQEAGGVSLGILPDGDRRPGQPLPHLCHRHQPGARPECSYCPQRRRPHRGGWQSRHHLRGGHRPETGETHDRPERHLGPAGAATGGHPRRSRGHSLGGGEKIGVSCRWTVISWAILTDQSRLMEKLRLSLGQQILQQGFGVWSYLG